MKLFIKSLYNDKSASQNIGVGRLVLFSIIGIMLTACGEDNATDTTFPL